MPVNKDNSRRKRRILREVIGYIVTIVAAVIIATLIRVFIFEPFIVPTPSMDPTLKVGDKVIINKLAFKFDPIERGDIIAFHSPIEDDKELVKRAIGIEVVMGDNRNNSYDSRYFGSISEESVFGKLLTTYWPPSRW